MPPPSNLMTRRSRRRLLLVVALLICGTGVGAAMSFSWGLQQDDNLQAIRSLAALDRGQQPRWDDTFEALLTARPAEKLRRAYGLSRYKFVRAEGHERVVIDARGASFIVANSGNPNPTAENDCKQGSEPVNPYPLSVTDSGNVTLIGGIIVSRVPQTSDWLYTYCNSTAVHIRRSPGAVVDGIRIAGGWDGVRASEGSPHLLLKNSWLSDIRDDAVENDYLYSASVHDTLIDGAFQGISVKSSGSAVRNGLQETLVLSGVLLRLKEYPYRGRSRFGAVTKNEIASPAIQIRNSVIAVDYHGAESWRTYWIRSWSKMVDAKDNIFLWLSDDPMPESLPVPPKEAGFQFVSGAAARSIWDKAKQNWIDCHPKVARIPSDPGSEIRRCDRNYWGAGFAGHESGRGPRP